MEANGAMFSDARTSADQIIFGKFQGHLLGGHCADLLAQNSKLVQLKLKLKATAPTPSWRDVNAQHQKIKYCVQFTSIWES